MRNQSVDTKLTSVQRLGYKLMAFFRRSTPNKGLDMLFNIMPIKYHLLKTATQSYFRTLQVAPYECAFLCKPAGRPISVVNKNKTTIFETLTKVRNIVS